MKSVSMCRCGSFHSSQHVAAARPLQPDSLRLRNSAPSAQNAQAYILFAGKCTATRSAGKMSASCLLPIADRRILSSDVQLLSLETCGAVALHTVPKLHSAFVTFGLLANTVALLLSDQVPVARQVYARYAPYQFLAYWHELWRDYESLVGPFASLDPQCYPLITGLAICPFTFLMLRLAAAPSCLPLDAALRCCPSTLPFDAAL